MDTWRAGDWFQTFSGKQFFPLDPRAEDIDPIDVAHHLAHLCRFNGAVRRFYSVAQHSVLVSRVVPPEHARWGLLHDATEAYVGDMIRPLKLSMPQYRAVERGVERAVAERFGLSLPVPKEVKQADVRLLMTERRDLLATHRDWAVDSRPDERVEPLQERIDPLPPAAARVLFLARFHELFEAEGNEALQRMFALKRAAAAAPPEDEGRFSSIALIARAYGARFAEPSSEEALIEAYRRLVRTAVGEIERVAHELQLALPAAQKKRQRVSALLGELDTIQFDLMSGDIALSGGDG